MNVTCPHCLSRYLLPESLMGPGGARVRCPRCQEAFLVTPDGDVAAAPQFAEAAMAPAPSAAEEAAVAAAPEPEPEPVEAVAAAPEGPEEVARRIVAALDQAIGAEIADATREGRLLSRFGARLLDAYDAYRNEAGRAVSAAPFREALRERWGVELTPAMLGERS